VAEIGGDHSWTMNVHYANKTHHPHHHHMSPDELCPVCLHVSMQIAGLSEAHETDWTGIRLLTCMGAHMLGEC